MNQTALLGLAGVALASAVAVAGLGGAQKKEGFATLPVGNFPAAVRRGQATYNNYNQIQNPYANNSPAADASAKALGSVSVNYGSEPALTVGSFSNPYPSLQVGPDSLYRTIQYCNSRPANAAAFTDRRFAQNCGVCLTGGKDELGQTFSGSKGLYISPEDRASASALRASQNMAFLPAKPSLAICNDAPSQPTFALSASDMTRFSQRLGCQNNKTLDNGCGKCFGTDTYSFVGRRPELNPVSLFLVGNGQAKVFIRSRKVFDGQLSAEPVQVALGEVQEGTPLGIDAITNDLNGAMVGGVLVATLPNQAPFVMPIDRIFTVDRETGNKPRLSGISRTIRDFPSVRFPILRMGTGKTRIRLGGFLPFTFLETAEFATMDCFTSPFQTQKASLSQPSDNPCLVAGQEAGRFSDECLRQVILDNGCTTDGSLYATPAVLNQPSGGAGTTAPTLESIVGRVSDIARRKEVDETASLQCTGKRFDTPCQPFLNDSGAPIPAQCLNYIYRNTGAGGSFGATYASNPSYETTDAAGQRLYCLPEGALAPIRPDGSVNSAAVSRLQQIGLQGFAGKRGIEAIKAFLAGRFQLAIDSSKNAYTDAERRAAISDCLGTLATPSPIIYGPWISKGPTRVSVIRNLNDGQKVYIIFEAPYTKMVSEKGEAKYYVGAIDQFNPNNWGRYSDAGRNYLLKFE